MLRERRSPFTRVYEAFAEAWVFPELKKKYPGAQISAYRNGNGPLLKYRLTGGENTVFARTCLRLFSAVYRDQVAETKELAESGCSVIAPLDSGSNGLMYWYTEPWVEGKELTEYVKDLSGGELLAAGAAVGTALRKLHTAKAVTVSARLSERLGERLERFRKGSSDLFGLKKEYLDAIGEVYAGTKGRPECLLHGDLHRRNILVKEDGSPLLIDLEALCVGDPMYDLATLFVREGKSSFFNRGVLEGYAAELSEDDWRRIGLYYTVRKISEYNFYFPDLPDYLASKGSWEARFELLKDPAAVRAAFL